MGVLDFLRSPSKQTAIKQDDEVYVGKTEDHHHQHSSSGVQKLPKVLRDIQEQLNSQHLVPINGKRTRKSEMFSYSDEQLPSKKKKVVTGNNFNNTSALGMISPEVTPKKIVKPAFSLADTLTSNTTNDSVVKKLDFSAESKGPISPPATPVKLESNSLLITPSATPKKLQLLESEDKKSSSLLSEEQKSPEITKSIFTRAKALFQRSYSYKSVPELPERSEEAKALNTFLLENIIQGSSSSLYISGPPGTGKTAQTKLNLAQLIDIQSPKPTQICEINGKDYKLRYTYINCMTISRVQNVYQDIFQNLTNSKTTISQSKDDLLEALSDSNQADMNIIVLDELDKLITSDQQILFEIFSWVIFPQTKMILLGISNALDMVDRLLPRLKINGLNPHTLSFLPYNSTQIANIIKSRLRLLNEDPSSEITPLFHPAAIQLASKKSSSNTGDLRKAFDICRRSIELLERELKTTGNVFNPNSIAGNTSLVKINHVARVCNNVFNQNQSLKLKSLNFLQKNLVCILVKAEEEHKNGNIPNATNYLTLNAFFEFYLKQGKSDSLIGVLKKGEFLEVLTGLESLGVIQINRVMNKNNSESRISSRLVKRELIDAIKGISILEQLVHD